MPGATLGGGVAVAFPAGCVQPTCESLGWGLPGGEGRCGTPPGDTRPPPWAPQVTSPLSSTPSPLVRLLRPEGCLCRFFLQGGQGRGLTFGWQRLSVFPLPYLWPRSVRTVSQAWTPPCL